MDYFKIKLYLNTIINLKPIQINSIYFKNMYGFIDETYFLSHEEILNKI